MQIRKFGWAGVALLAVALGGCGSSDESSEVSTECVVGPEYTDDGVTSYTDDGLTLSRFAYTDDGTTLSAPDVELTTPGTPDNASTSAPQTRRCPRGQKQQPQ